MRAFGASEEQVRDMQAALAEQQPAVVLWQANVRAYSVFCELATQWRVVPFPSGQVYYQGLEYASLPSVMDVKDKDLFRELRVMERAASEVLNQRRNG